MDSPFTSISTIKQVVFYRTTRPPDVTIRDRDDLLILASALAGSAEVLVTGDKELLVLGSIYNLEIISPRQFRDKIMAEKAANLRSSSGCAKIGISGYPECPS